MIKDVKVGQVIEFREVNGRESVTRYYTVKKIYPFHAFCERRVPETGAVICRSFCYGDLVVMGLEKQPEKYERLRKVVEGVI